MICLQRRPLNQIEAKFNTVQAEPLLSVAVEPYDLLTYQDNSQKKPEKSYKRSLYVFSLHYCDMFMAH